MTGADFIWLTEISGGRVLVNRSSFTMMKRTDVGTTLHCGSWWMNVRETIEQIMSAQRVSVGLDFVREMPKGKDLSPELQRMVQVEKMERGVKP